jgi:hypothetical protein
MCHSWKDAEKARHLCGHVTLSKLNFMYCIEARKSKQENNSFYGLPTHYGIKQVVVYSYGLLCNYFDLKSISE